MWFVPLIYLCFLQTNPPKPEQPKLLAAGTPAPDFTCVDLNGRVVKLSSFRGKVVMLDFWATWCGTCVESMPFTNGVARKLKPSNVVVLAVHVLEEKDAFQSWVPAHKDKEHDSLVFLRDPNGRHNSIAVSLYNVSGIPTQYIIDAKGIIRWSNAGFTGENDILEKEIKAARKPFVAQQNADSFGLFPVFVTDKW